MGFWIPLEAYVNEQSSRMCLILNTVQSMEAHGGYVQCMQNAHLQIGRSDSDLPAHRVLLCGAFSRFSFTIHMAQVAPSVSQSYACHSDSG